MQHKRLAGGSDMLMEIDHFDPTIRGRDRHRYANLFLATRHCNNKKLDNWPSPEEKARGIRFLNCCIEQDYGEHIFEDPKTHQVVGITPQGRYHVRILDLNAPHFVGERRDRTEIRKLLFEDHKKVKESEAAIHAFHLLERQLAFMIPPIPMLPQTEAS